MSSTNEAQWDPCRRILVAVDCSDYCNAATAQAVELAHGFEATITGLHAYAAKLHDLRFKQMEGGLPEQYRKEDELEHQRDVHDDLITRGLELISDSYLDQTQLACERIGVPFSRLGREGRNYSVLLEEARSGRHDLIVLGAQGLGAVQPDVVGTVCERVVRRTPIDSLVIKSLERKIGDGPILVALDGSEQSFGGLLTALELGARYEAAVHAVAVFDPYFHYVAFNRIADVLSEQAGEVFRFKEQEELHENIIDSGLAKIYQSHLSIAETIAAKRGVALHTTLADGKPYAAILKHLEELDPSLLVIGKVGIHTDDELDIGGNTQHLLRMARCNLWVSLRRHKPDVLTVAEQTTSWTEEAERRMDRVPSFVHNMARMAILRFAQERGHTVITESIVDEATAELMPGHAHRAMQAIVAADEANRLGRNAGGAALSHPWSEEASALLDEIEDTSLRRNLQQRAEKAARIEMTSRVEERHVRPLLPSRGVPEPVDQRSARDEVTWTSDALARLERVPEGFMRDSSRDRVESYARSQGSTEIDLDCVETGLAEARKAMSEAMTGGTPPSGADPQKTAREMPWDAEAEVVLERVPDGFMRNLTAQRTEARAGKLGLSRITKQVVEEQFSHWQKHSESVMRSMVWEAEAYEAIAAAPPVVRGMVVREIEAGAKRTGLSEVTLAYVESARAEWRATGSFHVTSAKGH